MSQKPQNPPPVEYCCPECSKNLTLGNTYNFHKGYLCIECAVKKGVKTVNPLLEKQIGCWLCKKELNIGQFIITPTAYICHDCVNSFMTSQAYVPHTKQKVNLAQYKVTLTFIIVIIALYFITSFPHFDYINNFFVFWGAMNSLQIQHHHYWLFISANLLHGNLMHLSANAFSIAVWGCLLEQSIGSRAILALILLSGFISSCFSFLLNPGVYSLGSSGIAYALMFAFVIYLVYQTILTRPSQVFQQLYAVIALVVIQIISNIVVPMPGPNKLDIWAHLGGSLTGIAFIILYLFGDPIRRVKKG